MKIQRWRIFAAFITTLFFLFLAARPFTLWAESAAQTVAAAWQQANETVHRRGGWRAYAQELQAPAQEGHDAAPQRDPHAGHGMHQHPAAPAKIATWMVFPSLAQGTVARFPVRR